MICYYIKVDFLYWKTKKKISCTRKKKKFSKKVFFFVKGQTFDQILRFYVITLDKYVFGNVSYFINGGPGAHPDRLLTKVTNDVGLER